MVCGGFAGFKKEKCGRGVGECFCLCVHGRLCVCVCKKGCM